jgi:hypothetical protein
MVDSKARVFLSCGQQKGTDEIQIASEISDRLRSLGFEPYVAVAEQTLKGLKENIFQRLRESEYFLFIDFNRERLGRPRQRWYEVGKFQDSGRHRGSLFSNQELAMATSLDIECLCFREEGVKEGDGILRYIQANSVPFTDRKALPDLIMNQVGEHGWKPNWRNQIVLERDVNEYEDVRDLATRGVLTRFLHIGVRNLHRRETAFECVAYLVGIRDLSNGSQKEIDLVEVKWKGVKMDRVAIPPGHVRYLDGCWVNHASPNRVTLGINRFVIDYSGYLDAYTLTGPNEFELAFTVFSYGLPPATAKFKLSVGTSLNDVTLCSAG